MHKTFKILRGIVLLPVSLPMLIGVFGTMWFAIHSARTDRHRAAWLLLRLATFIRRTISSPPGKKLSLTATLTSIAFLLQGAPWERVRHWSKEGFHSSTIARFYLAEGKLEDAHAATLDWCQDTDKAIAERREQMHEFFAQHGEELSPLARSEILMAIRQKEERAWKADPQNNLRLKWWEVSEEVRANSAYLSYYDAHLALEAVRWLQTKTDAPQRLAQARPEKDDTAMGLPQFRVNEDALRALGMEPSVLETARRRAMGQ